MEGDTHKTGPLSDHEIASLLHMPEYFSATRAAKEIVKWRTFFATLRDAVDRVETVEDKLLAIAAVMERFAEEEP